MSSSRNRHTYIPGDSAVFFVLHFEVVAICIVRIRRQLRSVCFDRLAFADGIRQSRLVPHAHSAVRLAACTSTATPIDTAVRTGVNHVIASALRRRKGAVTTRCRMRRVHCEMDASVNLGPMFSIFQTFGQGWRGSMHVMVQQVASHVQPKGGVQHVYESRGIDAREKSRWNCNHVDERSRMHFVASTTSKQQKIPSLDRHCLTRRQGTLPSKWFICGEDVKHTQKICLGCLSSNIALGTSHSLHRSSSFNMA